MSWDFNDDRPIYLQIATVIEQRILTGQYDIGSKLISVRDFALEAGVNPNTMQKALSKLEQDELVHSSRTSGRFVTDNEEVVRRRREEMANEYVKNYLHEMEQIGFDKKKATDFLNNIN